MNEDGKRGSDSNIFAEAFAEMVKDEEGKESGVTRSKILSHVLKEKSKKWKKKSAVYKVIVFLILIIMLILTVFSIFPGEFIKIISKLGLLI